MNVFPLDMNNFHLPQALNTVMRRHNHQSSQYKMSVCMLIIQIAEVTLYLSYSRSPFLPRTVL